MDFSWKIIETYVYSDRRGGVAHAIPAAKDRKSYLICGGADLLSGLESYTGAAV